MNAEEANFQVREINSRYNIRMPEYLAKWDAWGSWERERFASMEENLKKGDVLFDVGAENGAISCIYAGMVGAENMVLFESTPEYWPNIMATWVENGLMAPRAACNTLVSDRNQRAELFPLRSGTETLYGSPWPPAAFTENLTEARSYRYIHEHAHQTPQITLDFFSSSSLIKPNAITIDVEGAELLVLKGAGLILELSRPLVWVSVHPDLMERDYDCTPSQVSDYMNAKGYDEIHLAKDHETHMFYKPRV